MAGCDPRPQPHEAFAGPPLRERVHPGGVEIAVLAEGVGPAVATGEYIRIHYQLYLPDGTFVDGTHDEGPTSFVIGAGNELIEGLQLGVTGMKTAERRRIVVPAALGYRGRRVGAIGPDDDLIFEVERMP